MTTIPSNNFVLEVSQYGNLIILHSDSDRERFIKSSLEIITDQLNYHSLQDTNDVKNMNFHIYTN